MIEAAENCPLVKKQFLGQIGNLGVLTSAKKGEDGEDKGEILNSLYKSALQASVR